MLHRIVSVPLITVAAFFSAGCQSTGDSSQAASAQSIVDSVAAKHANVVRLSLHAIPSGESQMRSIASTSAAKRGKASDPEDMRALQSGEETVLQEGENLDVTVPITDGAGKRTCVVGVTLRAAGNSREQLVAHGRAIAGDVSTAIREAKQPLW